jgi:hypothetical protein
VAHGLNHTTVALGALVGDDDPPDGVLAASYAGESESY